MKEQSNESHEATGRRGECVVMKFGGTSVEDATAIRRVSQLVKRRLRHPPVVVVSALGGVTDQLLNAAKSAAGSRLESAREVVRHLRQRAESSPQRSSKERRSSKESRTQRASARNGLPGATPPRPQ